MPSRFLKKHRVRASVYHLGALVFISAALVNYIVQGTPFGWFDVFCVCYFVFDYVFEMFDPHPENPGPWLLRYFHRVYDGDEDDDQ